MTLRGRLVRLAFADPKLCPRILPLLKCGIDFPTEEALKKYLKEHPKADKTRHKVVDKPDGAAKKPPIKEIPSKSLDKPQPDDDVEVTPDEIKTFKGEIPDYNLEVIAGDGGKITRADLRRAKAVKRQIEHGIASAADVCVMSPPVCRKNLGILRRNMPQVMEDSIKKLLASDKEEDRKRGEAAVAAGAKRDDDTPMTQHLLDFLKKKGVEIKTGGKMRVGHLKATQKEIKAGKTFNIADAYFRGKYDPTKKPIIVSDDNYILDGHHRWSSMLTANPEAEMGVIQIKMPMREILDASFEMPGVFRADLQDNVIDENEPLDLARKPGSTWQQKDKWYGKSKKGEAKGPFKSKEEAKTHAMGKATGKKEIPDRPEARTGSYVLYGLFD